MTKDVPPPGSAGASAVGNLPTSKGATLGSALRHLATAPTALLLTQMSYHLLAYARRKLPEGEYQYAVVLSQAACELRAEDAIVELMRHRKCEYLSEAVLDLFVTPSFGDERIRSIFIALSGDDPAQATWWAAWRSARKLRNDVAHGGIQATADQATAAVDAAAAFIEHVTAAVESVRTTI